jgi:hypothetical protein
VPPVGLSGTLKQSSFFASTITKICWNAKGNFSLALGTLS